MSIYKKLLNIQAQLKAPKTCYNEFGNYHYRSAEAILEAVKPLLASENCTLVFSDSIKLIGQRYYVETSAKLIDCETGESIETIALAGEEEKKKKQDSSQTTGSASSYARKYALNGLFCIDDTKDSDATNDHGQSAKNTSQPNSAVSQNFQSAKISENQAKRLFALAKGNSEKVRSALDKFGYSSSKDILKKDYDVIAKAIEN